MLVKDGNHVTAGQATFYCPDGVLHQAVVIHRPEDTPMTTLRIRVRRAAKVLDVPGQIRILSDARSSVLAPDRAPGLSVQP